LLTDFVCLYNYEFWFSLCKIVRSSVILLLPLFQSFPFQFRIANICVKGREVRCLCLILSHEERNLVCTFNIFGLSCKCLTLIIIFFVVANLFSQVSLTVVSLNNIKHHCSQNYPLEIYENCSFSFRWKSFLQSRHLN
jgi:hypothetical protein